MTADPIGAGLQRYADFFAGLTQQSLDGLEALVTEDVHFRDPFNDVSGRAIMKRLFADMFRDCSYVKFRIDGAIREGDQAFLKWTFFYTPRRFGGPQPWQAIGVSELHFTPDGRVKAHLDHWDAGSQFYAHLPVVGGLVRFVRNRLRHS